MSTNNMLPNSFQVLNFYTDWLSYYLTAPEEKVLIRLIRETIGFSNHPDRTLPSNQGHVSVSVLLSGKKNAKGDVLCLGVGLGKNAILSALNGLLEYGVIARIGEKADHQEKGALYSIQLDSERIDVTGLAIRKDNKVSKSKKRTNKGRDVWLAIKALKSFENKDGGLSDKPLGGLSDKHKETNVKKLSRNSDIILNSKEFKPLVGLSDMDFDNLVSVLRKSLPDLEWHMRGNSDMGIKPMGNNYTDKQLEAIIAIEPIARADKNGIAKRGGTEGIVKSQIRFNTFSPAYKSFANAGRLSGHGQNTSRFNTKRARDEITESCQPDKIQLLFDIHRQGIEAGYWMAQHYKPSLTWLKVGKLPSSKYPESTNSNHNGRSKKLNITDTSHPGESQEESDRKIGF